MSHDLRPVYDEPGLPGGRQGHLRYSALEPPRRAAHRHCRSCAPRAFFEWPPRFSDPLSLRLAEIVNQGKLISDEIIIDLLSKRLEDAHGKGETGFIRSMAFL
ncbi:hypothetical protein CASFOL_017178 [Castilleja foliolosa]|uniref:Uncharacterized protein n=1 Tax=Castilleja foliolosa TaxID=1961234 RepID=A0ABD3DCF2_9LAMI